LNVSCSNAVGKPLRDAAIEGASGVIRDAVSVFLTDLLLPETP